MDDRIKVVVHHTRHFVSDDNGNLKFDGEITQWSCDPDLLCYFGIIASVKELGHTDIKELRYSLGGQSVVPERLELLTDDRGALHMVNIAMVNDEVHLYVVHNKNEPEITEMIEWVDGAVKDEVDVATQVEGEGEVQVGTEMENGHGEGKVEGEDESLVEGLVEGEVEREAECEVEGEAEVVTQLEEGPAEGEVLREVECEDEGLTQLEEGLAEGEVEREVERDVEGEAEGLTQLEEVEVANVDEVEVHDVDDFKLEDVEEDEDADENVEDDEDENVDESSSEESLVERQKTKTPGLGSWTFSLGILVGKLYVKHDLLTAIDALLPGVEQRFCVRHLYTNFRKQFPRKYLKRLMWTAATTTYPQLWEVEMRKIKEINLEAFKYLIAIAPRWSSYQLFEIIHISQFGDQFVVNLDKKECSCRKWLITAIPCTHAITAMKFLNVNAEDYIGNCYRKSTYEETYNSIVYPINGQVLWEKTSYPDVLPPKKRTMPDRPKKKRRLESWELKKNDTELRKGGSKKACAVCKQLGHN
ncbi:uncharacterized protein LOC106770218 [Vigna radiata var. radiata]|uniref:Uncharacterized protein LOC106770218 n=1 Tax=Vigna radiata var. radiata TaxID=3916 RepID=A0A1S3V009_VIGRR|nr:uncharacterized protein LOC106770218 [Vigna radiata var. radiata]